MLMLSIGLTLSISACPRPRVYVLDKDVRVIQKLPNGNWEVTEGYVLKFTALAAENSIFKEKIKAYEKKLGIR